MAETKEVLETKKVEKKKSKPNVFKRFANWLRTVKAELKKVSWTSPETVRKNTILVLVVMIILAAVTGLVDAIFAKFIYIIGIMI